MRIYSLIMSISIACGSGKGNEDDSTSQTGGTEATTEVQGESSSDVLPTTTANSHGMATTAESDPTTVGSTGMASSVSTSTSGSTGGEDSGESGAPETTDTDPGGTTSGTTGDIALATATVENSCAPDDGPALEFKLFVDAPRCGAGWSGDQLRILLFQGGPLAPGEYPLDGGFGFASFDDGQGAVNGQTGKIVIDEWTDTQVSGTYDVTLEDQTVHFGAFAGPYCNTMPLCG